MGPTGHRCLLATVLLAQAAPRVAHAARFYVDAESGDDADDGSTPDLAVATITRGVELIAGGDELIVGPGTYYERPVFENLGSSEELPVWIRASPRGEAIISGMWEQAATGRVTWHEEGDGTWSAEHGPVLFAAHAGTFLFRFASVEDLLAARAESVDLDMPPYGIAVDEEKIYVVLPDGSDPNTQPVLMSTPSWDETGSEEFLLMVAGSPTSSSTASCFGARGPTAC